MKVLKRDLDYYLDPDFKNLEKVIDLPFGIGETFKGKFPDDVVIIVKSKSSLPDFMICGAMYIVSKELKEVLEEAKDEAEFFPLKVWLRKTPYTKQEFYCFNPLNEIDAIDYEKSTYTLNEKHKWVDKISKLVIDESKVNGLSFFHIDNISPLFISDEMANKILNKKLIGINFVNVEDFESR